MLFSMRIAPCRPKTSVTTTTSTTTTTESSITTTTSAYEESRWGKGEFCRSPSGKCFLKRQFSFSFCDNVDGEGPSNESSKKFKNSDHREHDREIKLDHGIITQNSDANKLLFPEQQESTFIRVLSGIFSVLGSGSRLSDELRRR